MIGNVKGLDAKNVKAMVMAAGLGLRMRPLTDNCPKPLVAFAGKPLIDHALDKLAQISIAKAVVNAHYLADRLEQYLMLRTVPEIIISDERTLLLDTGGGAKNALIHLGSGPFLVINSDSVWLDNQEPMLGHLLQSWDGEHMDALLMLAGRADCVGYDGNGDFSMDNDGRLARIVKGKSAPLVNIGAYLIHPRLFDGAPDGPFSMNLLWDKALANNRLFGARHEGLWMHVGTPQSLELSQAHMPLTELSAKD